MHSRGTNAAGLILQREIQSCKPYPEDLKNVVVDGLKFFIAPLIVHHSLEPPYNHIMMRLPCYEILYERDLLQIFLLSCLKHDFGVLLPTIYRLKFSASIASDTGEICRLCCTRLFLLLNPTKWNSPGRALTLMSLMP